MNEIDAERVTLECMAGIAVTLIELHFRQLIEHAAYMTPAHAARIVAAVERYSEARRQLIPPLLLPMPAPESRN